MSRPLRSAAVSLMTEKSLIVAAGKYHGLGNRVRAVLGSEVLARLEGRVFAYAWPTGATFGAAFDDLWEYDRVRVPALVSRALAWRAPYRDGKLGWLDDRARKERLWQLRTPHALSLPSPASWEDELRLLRPVSDVRARVSRVFDAAFSDRPFVGIMVRAHAHSHEATRLHSPVSWYLTRMKEIRGMWPDVGFFVSADTDAALQQILQEFPDAVSQHDKGDYNSKSALVASVADLYLLASSSHILAPHFSSFPELAESLAGQGLGLETSQNGVLLSSLTFVTRAGDPLTPWVRRPL
ncbi:hypothetical protein [Mycetocola sp. 2940]|uniref:hypothetical protein n=1 Tax=Mycetocola sp. 2940 TaxID=3156452 RepID=UPI003395450D